MALFASRPAPERASVALSTVKCSSCAASIPLSSLGEHVCLPVPTRAIGSRSTPRPSQIAIPARPPIQTASSSSSFNIHNDPSPRPPFAGPSSARSSPSSLDIPRPSLSAPGGASTGYATPSPRTPSPTNPFFPHPPGVSPKPQAVVHGLGLGVGGRPEGPFPTDAPLTAGMSDLSMISGGNAGMAGVGRRAFAAAAWGVRAGVALASTSSRATEDQQQPQHPPFSAPPQHASQPALPPWQQAPRTGPTPSTREPPIFPKAPLSGRQRSGTLAGAQQPTITVRSPQQPTSPPQRSTSAMASRPIAPNSPPQRSASAMASRSPPINQSPPRRKESLSSTTSHGDSISQLLKARAGEPSTSTAATNAKLPFFERYKQLADSRSNSPVLGIALPSRRSSEDDAHLVASPAQTNFDADSVYDDEGSALPWATPALAASPEIKQGGFGGFGVGNVRGDKTKMHMHQRNPTAESESSSGSSGSGSGRYGASSGGGEEVVTPSQSWEGGLDRSGLGVRRPVKNGLSFDMHGGLGVDERDKDGLEQIGEDDEDGEDGERVVFGGNGKSNLQTQRARYPTTGTSPASNPPQHSDSHTRSRTVPEVQSHPPHQRTHSSSSSSTRKSKSCVKCGESVGGTKRFVERDGVVLCERDWKKLYLPSCRRCNLPIEKSAVSSSDGQLKGKWHKECFSCTKCERAFEGETFYVLEGKPWCQLHYHEENGTLCAAGHCRLPIEGPCVLTQNPNAQRFHPGHLRCDHRGGVSGAQTCRENMDEYYEVGGGRYCERHVGEVLRSQGGSGLGGRDLRAEKRRTRLVDLPVGGF